MLLCLQQQIIDNPVKQLQSCAVTVRDCDSFRKYTVHTELNDKTDIILLSVW